MKHGTYCTSSSLHLRIRASLQVVPIKLLLLWLETARRDVDEGGKVSLLKWEEVLHELA